MCLESHMLRKTEDLKNYYLNRFLTSNYTCRTCNKYPHGIGYHCRHCVFDICLDCESIIVNKIVQNNCLKGHLLVWIHDLCKKIQDKYSVCKFRCEVCQESFLGGGGYACIDCEFYTCVKCENSTA